MQQPYPQQPYPQYQQRPPAPIVPGKNMIMISLICGGASLLFGLLSILAILTPAMGPIMSILGLLCGIGALITSVLGSKQMKTAGHPVDGVVTLSLILAIMGTAFCYLFTITCSMLACNACQAQSAMSSMGGLFRMF